MFSIYTSLYNLENSFIDWRAAIDNFTDFADELCIATDNSGILTTYFQKEYNKKCLIKLYIKDIDLKSPYFDGRLKNEALKLCTQPYCILLDADEKIRLNDKWKFESLAEQLGKSDYLDAIFIPVIDLFHSEDFYKDVSSKWYLHKNKPNIGRGVVNFAKKEDGTINISASDSCELIYLDTGDLVHSTYLLDPRNSNAAKLDMIRKNNCPVIYHLGWLDKEKRLKSNQFWQPVWNARAGHEVTNIIHSKEKLDKIEFWPHGLKLWYE